MKKFLLLLSLSCAHVDALQASCDSLAAAGEAFTVSVDAMHVARDAGVVSAEAFTTWRAAALAFQATYPNQVQACEAAIAAQLAVDGGAP